MLCEGRADADADTDTYADCDTITTAADRDTNGNAVDITNRQGHLGADRDSDFAGDECSNRYSDSDRVVRFNGAGGGIQMSTSTEGRRADFGST